MTRLKLSDITDGKPVKLTIEIPARLHRRLVEYGTVLNGGIREDAPVASHGYLDLLRQSRFRPFQTH
jgi:hypothetical protein